MKAQQRGVRAIELDEFAGFVRQYERLVITVCLAFTKNYFDAEDLAQETFLSAYRSFERFDGKNPKSWVTAIAANKCRDYLRSPVKRRTALAGEELTCVADEGDSPQTLMEREAGDERAEKLCRKLKEPYRSVALAYFCEGKKLSELAAETGENLKTLQTRLYRAKKVLQILWRKEEV